jgi:hypothetical protein
MFTAGDVEVHSFTKKNHRIYCLLDLARCFPPDSNRSSELWQFHRQSVFFRMIRPELLSYLKHSSNLGPLSPDAMTARGIYDSQGADFDERTRFASQFILKQQIPMLVDYSF